MNKTLGTEGITSIRSQGSVTHDPKKIADEFNNFFTRIGKEISNSIPNTTKQPEEYINYGRDIPDLNLGNTTAEQIIMISKELANKNSKDILGVTSKMIKFVIHQISRPLSHIFNLSLSSGIFPNKLKQCRVVPIFKSGDSLECDNFRPISLLNTISKLLEKIVAKKLNASQNGV
jgi:hypothetical protein